MTDYTEEVLDLIRENLPYQKPFQAKNTQIELVDWTKEETYNPIMN